jgi:HEAT repeat protein
VLLFNNAEADPQDALTALRQLVSSSSPPHHAVGLAASIQLGSDAAISALAAELPSLGSNPKLFQILTAIGLYYQPNGNASLAPLQQLIASGVPGMDAAVAAALGKINTKQVAPVMAQLLSSPDTNAQLAAAAFFGYYSLFADKNGNIGDANLAVGPFATADTQAYTPRSNSPLTAAQVAEFWKTWWSQNKFSLGF